MQTHLSGDSPSLMMSHIFFLVGVGVVGSTFLKGKCMPYFQIGRGGQKTPLASIDPHLPSTQNNPYAVLEYDRVLGSIF